MGSGAPPGGPRPRRPWEERYSTRARESTLDLAGGFIQAANGGQVNVDPGATKSLITLHGGSHTLAASAIGDLQWRAVHRGQCERLLDRARERRATDRSRECAPGGWGRGHRRTPATATLGGALLNAGGGSTLNLAGGYIEAANGGQVTVTPAATNSLITLRGGNHTLGASAIRIANGGQFTGGSASAPLIDLDNAQLTGLNRVLHVEVGAAG